MKSNRPLGPLAASQCLILDENINYTRAVKRKEKHCHACTVMDANGNLMVQPGLVSSILWPITNHEKSRDDSSVVLTIVKGAFPKDIFLIIGTLYF